MQIRQYLSPRTETYRHFNIFLTLNEGAKKGRKHSDLWSEIGIYDIKDASQKFFDHMDIRQNRAFLHTHCHDFLFRTLDNITVLCPQIKSAQQTADDYQAQDEF